MKISLRETLRIAFLAVIAVGLLVAINAAVIWNIYKLMPELRWMSIDIDPMINLASWLIGLGFTGKVGQKGFEVYRDTKTPPEKESDK